MQYTDTHFTPRPSLVSKYPEHLGSPTNEELLAMLVRIETRLVKLMQHSGLNANGKPREDY